MKKYRGIVTPEAQAGIRESFLYIFERSPLNAERWLKQLYAEIDTLEQFPKRCARARERDFLEEDLRQLSVQIPSGRLPDRQGIRHRSRSTCAARQPSSRRRDRVRRDVTADI